MENYKEKYECALETIQEILSSGSDSIMMSRLKLRLQSVFPELKESEDERIRKDLLAFIKAPYVYDFIDHDRVDPWIAWLEKQGDKDKLIKELGEYKVKYTQEILSQQFEKQGEQKPVDNVEPKFHEGDWILNNACFPVQIASIEDGMYIFTEGDGLSVSFVDENYHLWTIQDAKDGDVLACNEEILLFKSYSVQGRISVYCWYNGQTNNFHSIGVNDASLTTRNKICPATKEQCDTIFAKMKEAGFEWNADKKELKKINSYCQENCKGYQETGKCFADGGCDAYHKAEQKPIESPRDYHDIDPHFGIPIESPRDYHDIDPHFGIPVEDLMSKKNHADKVEPIFSIGDVLCDKSCTTLDKNSQPNIEILDIRNGMYICNNCTFPISEQDEYELVAKRIEPQPAWSEEDKDMARYIGNAITCKESAKYLEEKGIDMIKAHIWLDSLKPQIKEWSDEDELRFNCTVGYLKRLNDANGDVFHDDIDWLKSLKDRLSWKPSKEQMDALLGIMIESGFDYIDYNILESLYNDLKRL